MPCIDAFGRELDDALGGDDRLFSKLAMLCALHCEMRVSERIVAFAQRELKARLEAGGAGKAAVEAAVERYNSTMEKSQAEGSRRRACPAG